jgi:hypothetical protein
MNPRELVDRIRSGPAKLVLDRPLRFNLQIYNPCDFNEFLQALQSSETIRDIRCRSHLRLRISEDKWVLLVKALGRIKDIQHLEIDLRAGSCDFHPFRAVADAVNNAQSLCKLVIGTGSETFPRDPSGLIALANALREHTALREFTCLDKSSREEAAPRDVTLDPVLRALPACPHLQKVFIMTTCASADAMKHLLQLQYTTVLHLAVEKEYWLAVADEIRRGRCNIQRLGLVMLQGAPFLATTEAVQALAIAIQMDRNLEHLYLKIEDGFTDEAGVALAEALTVNKTLRYISLSARPVFRGSTFPTTAVLGAPTYEALSAMMMRRNTSLNLKLPPFEAAGADERLRESRDQLRIEQRLNDVGRGRLLASSQTTREHWVDTLDELNSCSVDDSSAFRVSCLYCVLRSNPSVVCMS